MALNGGEVPTQFGELMKNDETDEIPYKMHQGEYNAPPAILGLEKKQKSRWKWRGCKRGSRVLPGDKETGGTSMVNHLLHHLQRHME